MRAATSADEEQIVALQCARNGDECDAPVRELLRRPGVGPERFAVAVDDGRVVSSLCLIPDRLRIDGVELSAGQVEYVATAETHERRGLVRRLMDRAHEWSRADGHLVEVIAGIPYFYRRFGYEYAAPFPRVWLLARPAAARRWVARPATVDDAERLVALQRSALDGVALACVGGDVEWWRRRLAGDVEPRWFVAERAGGGEVGAAASIGDGPPGVAGVTLLRAPVVAGHDAQDALAALAAEAATTGRPPAIHARPAIDDLVRPSASLHPRRSSLYVRVADPVALLDHLRPALTNRLRAAGIGTGELHVSFYVRSVLLTFVDGEVTTVEARPGVQDPVGHGGIGVPPDLVATLLFGKHGAAGLAEGHEDVRLGAHAELAEVLFPRLDGDLTLL